MEDNNKTPKPGAVLAVDDQATQRTKIGMGATRLGHRVTSVASAADKDPINSPWASFA